MKTLLVFILTLSLLPAQTPAELDRTVRKLAPDLVECTVAVLLNGGSGSGVIVSADGLVITAAHVTSEPNQELTVLLSDGRELPALSLGVDHETDGALLKITAPGPFPFRPYISEKNYEVGDWVIATGHPGGPVVGRPSPVRLGRISKAGTKSGFSDAITTNAMVISGDSGGPLYNLEGEVIGINSNISGSWRINKHVPLPSIVARWDALLASESFGRPSQMMQQNESLFDEPYANLREKFEEALLENANDPDAASLLKRPRLLDPHHMQALLDRWAPDPEDQTSPQYGFTLQGNTPRITNIIPDSPADKAGLKQGDTLTSVNGTSINNTIALALKLKTGDKITLETSTGSTHTITPEQVIARKQFPPPVSGMIDIIVTNDEEDEPLTPNATEDFLADFTTLHGTLTDSILPLKNYKGETLVLATVIDEAGQLLTKASEIENIEGVYLTWEGQDYPVRILGSDEDYDLALLQVDVYNLIPVRQWDIQEPKVGQLLLSPTKRRLTSGVITQPARKAPAKGYEVSYSKEQPSSYLGVTFTEDSDKPILGSIATGSPADKVGFLEGDEILKVEDTEVDNISDLIKILSTHSAGEKIAIVVKRGDKELTLEPILDFRPAAEEGSFSRSASQRDNSLSTLSARGGSLSKRRNDFPRCFYHDTPLTAKTMGTPLLNLEGKIIGFNIARALRHRTLAIPTKEINDLVAELRRNAN